MTSARVNRNRTSMAGDSVMAASTIVRTRTLVPSKHWCERRSLARTFLGAVSGLVSCWIYRRHDQEGFGATMNPREWPSYAFRFDSMAGFVLAHQAELASSKIPSRQGRSSAVDCGV